LHPREKEAQALAAFLKSEDLVKLYHSPFAGAARVIVSQGDNVRERGGAVTLMPFILDQE
jgi:hypothetical protein